MSTLRKQNDVVGGINVNVFSYTNLSEQGRPVAILFLLHGRHGAAKMLDDLAERLLGLCDSQGSSNRDLVIVSFDHRNHGTRLVNKTANDHWAAGNERHAIDMYAIQVGSATDVSFMIDFLPGYLFPSGERQVHEWLLSGISLGGHSTWISLRNEPRINIGIPIIGCPDYLALMRPRAEASGFSTEAPVFPPSLIEYIRHHDPGSVDSASHDPSRNPFLGKHILVLSGAADTLVPWSASKRFVDELQVGSGTKRVFLEEGAGHECTPKMVQELASFVWEHALKISPRANY
ncbi:Alpha/Beta hydrolase protein [Hysterangium stoloniferum]|nr:Alpha/Beta hydrolase protein [Hysterangium stoloniferum]